MVPLPASQVLTVVAALGVLQKAVAHGRGAAHGQEQCSQGQARGRCGAHGAQVEQVWGQMGRSEWDVVRELIQDGAPELLLRAGGSI